MSQEINQWEGCRIGITGASGALGKALTKEFRLNGAFVIGITHKKILKSKEESTKEAPQEWIQWTCGDENKLNKTLSSLDILIINHGLNPKWMQDPESIDASIEINALSSWRLIKNFESIILNRRIHKRRAELWINSSEAEIQPAFSPAYELSKRLIGQLVSLRWSNLHPNQRKNLFIRKLILGPFKSELNPIGIMKPNFVANMILLQSRLNLPLIIVSPNPITFFVMPITEILRLFYYRLTKINKI